MTFRVDSLGRPSIVYCGLGIFIFVSFSVCFYWGLFRYRSGAISQGSDLSWVDVLDRGVDHNLEKIKQKTRECV